MKEQKKAEKALQQKQNSPPAKKGKLSAYDRKILLSLTEDEKADLKSQTEEDKKILEILENEIYN